MSSIKKKRRRNDYERQKGRGFYVMQRGWQDHPLWKDEPFSSREAWCWLIENAVFSHDGRRVEHNGLVRILSRGQLSYSIRYLAEAWGWDHSKVNRYLAKLQRNGMIETNTETGMTIITICNYNKYQRDYKTNETQSETLATQKRNSSATNNNNVKKEKKDNHRNDVGFVSQSNPDPPPPSFKKPQEPWQYALSDMIGIDNYNSWISVLKYKKDGYLYAISSFSKDTCQQRFGVQIADNFKKHGLKYLGIKVSEQQSAKGGKPHEKAQKTNPTARAIL